MSATDPSPRESSSAHVEDSAPRASQRLPHVSADERDWTRVLRGGSPRAILARLVPGDPLGVRRVVAERLEAQALFLDADRVHLSALARCARYATRYDGRPRLDLWLREHVDEALRDVLRAEANAATGSDVDLAVGAHQDLARPLGLDPAATRRACVWLNGCTLAERSAFARLVIRCESLDEVARDQGASATAVARRARRVLDAVLSGAFGAPPGARAPSTSTSPSTLAKEQERRR